CTSGRCTNTGWQTPTATVCLSCHDAADAYGHAQANTATIGGVQVEACDVCHGVGKTFSVSTMHNITSPYVPPYPREMQ
ncbi:MAG TPA: hypothetical protein VK454_08760, partial [Myxococcaceae bacterium]|nr:hypothetical protein [Myxococcaceae bacterium]